MSLISLILYYHPYSKVQSFEHHEKQCLYCRSKTNLLQLLTSVLQLPWQSTGRNRNSPRRIPQTSFRRLFCNELSLKEVSLSHSFQLQKGRLDDGSRLFKKYFLQMFTDMLLDESHPNYLQHSLICREGLMPCKGNPVAALCTFLQEIQ